MKIDSNSSGINETWLEATTCASSIPIFFPLEPYFFRNGNKRFINYPLVEGYSDFVIVPRSHIELFCHYCGIFAAMNLWVDAAVATSLLLCGSPIKTENESNYIGTEYWNNAAIRERLKSANNKLEEIEKLFKNNELYIHPIKLSAYN